MMSRESLLIINGAILTVCAFFLSAESVIFLTALMLFLPLLDKEQRQLQLKLDKQKLTLWLCLLSLIGALLLLHPAQLQIIFPIIALTALPEEWFFRRYLQNGLNKYFHKTGLFKSLPAQSFAIISSSLLFTALHLPLQGTLGLAVFFPSLILGYIYQLKQDLIFVILLHSLFNLFFIIYVKEQYVNLF